MRAFAVGKHRPSQAPNVPLDLTVVRSAEVQNDALMCIPVGLVENASVVPEPRQDLFQYCRLHILQAALGAASALRRASAVLDMLRAMPLVSREETHALQAVEVPWRGHDGIGAVVDEAVALRVVLRNARQGLRPHLVILGFAQGNGSKNDWFAGAIACNQRLLCSRLLARLAGGTH